MSESSINRPGGTGRITCIHRDDDGDVEGLDVKYVVETGTDTLLDPILVKISSLEQKRQRRTKNASDKVHKISPVSLSPKRQVGKENHSDYRTKAAPNRRRHRETSDRMVTTPVRNHKKQNKSKRKRRESTDDACASREQNHVPEEILIHNSNSKETVFSPLPTEQAGVEEQPQRQYMLPARLHEPPSKMREVFHQQMKQASDFALEMVKRPQVSAKTSVTKMTPPPVSLHRQAFVTALFEVLRDNDDNLEQESAITQVASRVQALLPKETSPLDTSKMEKYLTELEEESRIMRSDGHIFAV